jgi:hypothetical protein
MTAGTLTAGIMLIAVGSAVLAQVRSGAYGSAKSESLSQTAPPAFTPDAEYSVTAFPSLPADLADSEGLQETQSFCAMCHSTRYITMQPPLPAAVWEAEVNKMIKTYGAPIPDASAKKIIAYLQATTRQKTESSKSAFRQTFTLK